MIKTRLSVAILAATLALTGCMGVFINLCQFFKLKLILRGNDT